jgi:FAD/FMN-containing dehydrogenase
VVLPDGKIMNLLSELKKDNTGYDLKNIFIGAEGTLGIITAATLKLFQLPKMISTLFVEADTITNSIV